MTNNCINIFKVDLSTSELLHTFSIDLKLEYLQVIINIQDLLKSFKTNITSGENTKGYEEPLTKRYCKVSERFTTSQLVGLITKPRQVVYNMNSCKNFVIQKAGAT